MSAATPSHGRQSPLVGVGVLLVDAFGRVLLTLRKLPPEAHCWSILGGKLDFLEPLEECAIREAREEAGVEIVIERLLCVTDHRLPSENQHWVSPAFLGRIVSGEPRNCEPLKNQRDPLVLSRRIASQSNDDRAQRHPCASLPRSR
jgi:8-oxo-dGTP diphosphatase